MYFMALALDYDGTLSINGKVSEETILALTKLKASGRRLILVTGRQIEELKKIFERLDLFDRVVAENGALIYTPQSQAQQLLAEPPPPEFIEKLKACGVTPIMIGNVIVSTHEPQEITVLKVIREMNLELNIIFNKGAVMILPSSVNKATGLTAVLKELGLSMHNVVGIGDAENDHSFLRAVGLGVAVANASAAVKQSAALTTMNPSSLGVAEIIKQLLENEYEFFSKVQHKIPIGTDRDNILVELAPADRVLIAGNSGIGKSTLATVLTEKMVLKSFQFCIFDPEGDYEKLENSFSVGEAKIAPSVEQVIDLLKDPSHSIVVNTLGIDLNERPAFFVNISTKLINLKASTGRPHWIIIDEAHHLMPAAQQSLTVSLIQEGTILITVHPEAIEPDALKVLNVIILMGPQAPAIMEKVSKIIGEALPNVEIPIPNDDELLVWQRTPISAIKIVKAYKPLQQHKRHTRKYATGNLDDELCFYFRGPNNALYLKAQNLMIFLQIAEGVDDATWMYHLRRSDYSHWFQIHIKDDILSKETAIIERDKTFTAAESRELISNLIKRLYTAPASLAD
ncbi:MAG: HAD-IIB family hydrolase [Parachlamydiaceae bacterium]|nr:HAD-IIB family hydrolase [Parachlamydiaceae bacterium]